MAENSPKMIEGVRINCIGDMEIHKAKQYVSVKVADNDSVFKDFMLVGDPMVNDHPIPSYPISAVSALVGIPVHVRKIPPDAAWKDAIEEL